MIPIYFRNGLLSLVVICLATFNLACSQTENQPRKVGFDEKASADDDAKRQVNPVPSFKKIGTLHKSIRECSGICISRRYPQHFWVHNDSGHKAEVYLVDRSGDKIAELGLKGVKNRDFEDIVSFSSNGRNYFAIGDVGDNGRRRKDISIYVFEEPDDDHVKKEKSIRPITSIILRYEDKVARDSEALAYLPSTGQFLLCSKSTPKEMILGKSAELFSIDFDLDRESQESVAKKIGNIAGGMITAMDCSSDGKKLVVRNYLYANLWELRSKDIKSQIQPDKFRRIILPVQKQNEAICFDKGGNNMITTSEGKEPDIFEVKLEAN